MNTEWLWGKNPHLVNHFCPENYWGWIVYSLKPSTGQNAAGGQNGRLQHHKTTVFSHINAQTTWYDASYLVAIDHEVVRGDERLEHNHPAGVGGPLEQRVGQLGNVHVHLVGAVDQICDTRQVVPMVTSLRQENLSTLINYYCLDCKHAGRHVSSSKTVD